MPPRPRNGFLTFAAPDATATTDRPSTATAATITIIFQCLPHGRYSLRQTRRRRAIFGAEAAR